MTDTETRDLNRACDKPKQRFKLFGLTPPEAKVANEITNKTTIDIRIKTEETLKILMQGTHQQII